ncbi:hypothetical protein [Thioclava sp. GXIMD4216]|uniref:hypothetical protein n=1 Tax=Thioclava sp. GXIMD4216 TaxID=3131929 RepID=UPI0030CC42AF
MIAPLFRTWRYPAFWGLLFLAQLFWGAVSFAVAAYQNMGQNMDHITLLAAFMGMNSVSETLMAQAMLWLCLRPFFLLPELWLYYALRHYYPYFRNPRAVTVLAGTAGFVICVTVLALRQTPPQSPAFLLFRCLSILWPAPALAFWIFPAGRH